MINIEYANAYREVIEILKYIPEVDYIKIPKNKIALFENNANKEYKFNYNPNLTLDEQGVSKRTKAIIAILFRDYWATKEQREKIVAKQNYDKLQIEKEKQEKYNVDDIFKTSRQRKLRENTINTKKMVEYNESILKRILNRIKSLFN